MLCKMTEAWKSLVKFSMPFAKYLWFSYATYKSFLTSFYDYIQQTIFVKVKRHFGGFKKLFYETYEKLG